MSVLDLLHVKLADKISGVYGYSYSLNTFTKVALVPYILGSGLILVPIYAILCPSWSLASFISQSPKTCVLSRIVSWYLQTQQPAALSLMLYALHLLVLAVNSPLGFSLFSVLLFLASSRALCKVKKSLPFLCGIQKGKFPALCSPFKCYYFCPWDISIVYLTGCLSYCQYLKLENLFTTFLTSFPPSFCFHCKPNKGKLGVCASA